MIFWASGRTPATAQQPRPGAIPQAAAPGPSPEDSLRSPRAAGDSLATGVALDDSLATAAADSGAAPDSVAVGGKERRWWDESWAPRLIGDWAEPPAIDRGQLYRTSAMLFSQALQQHTRLGLHEAGSHIAWDLPYAIGPGIERQSLWLNGSPTTGESIGEAHAHTVSPLLLEEVRLLAPDPFLDPLGDAGDGMIWTRTQTPDWEEIPSHFRLTEGIGESSTEDIFFARETGVWRAAGSYAHAHTEGRQYTPLGLRRYRDGSFENLLVQVDRAMSSAGLRVEGARRTGDYTLINNRKLLWESGQLWAGVQLEPRSELTGELRLNRRHERFQWWGPEDSGRRRTGATEVYGRARLRALGAELYAALAYERVSHSLKTFLTGDSTWTSDGIGLAWGLRTGDDAQWASLTLGWTDPWWGGGHLRARLEAQRILSDRMALGLRAWTGESPVFIPRLEPDGDALVREGLHLPSQVDSETGPVRRMIHAELDASLRWWGAKVAPALFVRRVTGALGLDPARGYLLLPEYRDDIRLQEELGDVTLAGGRVALDWPLRWGFRIEGHATALFDPALDALPVLVPAFHGEGTLLLEGRLFKNDLEYRLSLASRVQGEMHTPVGGVPARAQLDGEIHLIFLERAHLFLTFRNLTDEWFESATYDDGWGALPFRSSTTGLEWHFSD